MATAIAYPPLMNIDGSALTAFAGAPSFGSEVLKNVTKRPCLSIWTTAESTSVEDTTNSKVDVRGRDEDVAAPPIYLPPAKHSILSTSVYARPTRQAGEKKKKRVRFNPGVLMWQVAEDGDTDNLLKAIQDAFEHDALTSGCGADDSPYSEPVNFNMSNWEDVTVLHLCCYLGSVEAVRLLLQLGANPNMSDKQGWTPLHVAAACNDVQLTSLLLASGARASLQDQPGMLGLASVTRDSRVVRLIMQHARLCERSERSC